MTNRLYQTIVLGVLATTLSAFIQPRHSLAQLTRERANPGGPVEETFAAPTLVTTSTTLIPERGSLEFTIMHSFGIITDGVNELFGLDGVANIRFGFDYSITDRLTVGIGRSRFDKVYDGRAKASIIRQSRDGRVPITVAVQGGIAIETSENDLPIDVSARDRVSYMTAIMFARKLTERVSVQVAPFWGHFNLVVEDQGSAGATGNRHNDQVAIVGIARVRLTEWVGLAVEHITPVHGQNSGTAFPFSFSLELDSGGHVFQVFVTNAQLFTPQHMIAETTDDFLAGDFRLGFNVHRVFALGRG